LIAIWLGLSLDRFSQLVLASVEALARRVLSLVCFSLPLEDRVGRGGESRIRHSLADQERQIMRVAVGRLCKARAKTHACG
jgi:hypothetical protein